MRPGPLHGARSTKMQAKLAPACHIEICYFLWDSHFFTHKKKQALHVIAGQDYTHKQELVSLFVQSVTSLSRVWSFRDSPISTAFFEGKSFEFEIFFGKCNTSSRVKTPRLSKMYQLV